MDSTSMHASNQQSAGLRRIDQTWINNGHGEDSQSHSECGSAIYYGGDGGSVAPSSVLSSALSSAFAIEQQKQQLFGICEMVQSNIKTLLDQISRIIVGMGQQQSDNAQRMVARPLDLLTEYELGAWPVLVDVDSEVKLLSKTLRQTIDRCNINEPRLGWLLAVNKFQVKLERMLDKLINSVSVDIERVLRLRVRCHIQGLELRKETVEAVQEMQKEIRSFQ